MNGQRLTDIQEMEEFSILTGSICTHLLLQMITLALLFPHLLLQERRFRIHSVDNVQQQFLTLFIFPFCSETVLP